MTNPMLDYQTPPPNVPTGLRIVSWIVLLILGILYGLAGAFIAFRLFRSFSLLSSLPAGIAANVAIVVLLAMGILALLTAGIGIVYIWAAFRVRRGSRAAVITAIIVSTVNALAILSLEVFGFIAFRHDIRFSLALIDILFILICLLPGAANVAAAILLSCTLRQMRRSTLPQQLDPPPA